MSTGLRWGILGTGNIAHQFAAGMTTARRGQIVAAGSRQDESAREFSRLFEIRRAHASYEKLITDPQVDAIYNSLPNSMHHEWTIKALRAGKHVLCEKPMACNLHETREMFQVARECKRVLIEAFMYRAHPLTHAVQQAVRGGAIGELRMIRTSFCYHTTRLQDRNIRFRADLAGGGLMDVGCYCISFSRLFAGAEPTSVHVDAHVHESGVDDLVSAAMKFPNDILATFTCGMRVHADNTAQLCGTDGYIEIPIPWKPPMENASYTVAHSIPPRQDGPPTDTRPLRNTLSVDAEIDLYALEGDAFAECVLDGKPPFVSEQDTLGNMAVLDEMRRQIFKTS